MLVLIDLLGTLAFAISGASKAIYYKLDWLGLLVMAIVTGVGGGITRDLLLGSTPPLALQNPNYIMVCIAGAFLTLIVEKRFRFFMKLTLIIDALGLGFLPLSVQVRRSNGLECSHHCSSRNDYCCRWWLNPRSPCKRDTTSFKK